MTETLPLNAVALFYALIFLTGLVFGSFLNVVIYRLPLEKSIIRPRSFCP
ncbi:prepilin peptidase, partial [bacterium]|nr:prepilin peptidase [bacterium]